MPKWKKNRILVKNSIQNTAVVLLCIIICVRNELIVLSKSNWSISTPDPNGAGAATFVRFGFIRITSLRIDASDGILARDVSAEFDAI